MVVIDSMSVSIEKKWVKKENDRDISLVKEYYGYNNSKAIQALSILTPEQLSIIREKLNKGGV